MSLMHWRRVASQDSCGETCVGLAVGEVAQAGVEFHAQQNQKKCSECSTPSDFRTVLSPSLNGTGTVTLNVRWSLSGCGKENQYAETDRNTRLNLRAGRP